MTELEIINLMKAKCLVKAKTRKSAKTQVMEAKKQLIKDIRREFVLKKRGLPGGWQKGIVIAMDILDQYYEQ